MTAQSAYEAYQEGNRLLESSSAHAAVVVLERARELEPDKGSIRETLGRAYFRTADSSPPATSSPGRSSSTPSTTTPSSVSDCADCGRATEPAPAAISSWPWRCGPSGPNTATRWPPPSDAADPRPVVVCDLDGVLWRGDEPIDGATTGVAALRDRGPARGLRHQQLEPAGGGSGRQVDGCGCAGDRR